MSKARTIRIAITGDTMAETITVTELAAKASPEDRQGAERDYAHEAAQGCACTVAEATRRAMVRWFNDHSSVHANAPYWAAYALAARADQASEDNPDVTTSGGNAAVRKAFG